MNFATKALGFRNVIFCTLVLFPACGRIAAFQSPLDGYWKGFYQYTLATRAGVQSKEWFRATPIPIYLKLEQTDNTVLGMFSTTFDADMFKSSPHKGEREINGSISGNQVSMSLTEIDGSPPTVITATVSNGKLTGIWKQTWPGNQTEYSGTISLTKY